MMLKKRKKIVPMATKDVVNWYVAWAVMSGAKSVSHERVFLLAALADEAYRQKYGSSLITGEVTSHGATVGFDDLKSVPMPHEEGYAEVYANFQRTYAYDKALEGHLIRVASEHILFSDEELEAKVLVL